jgi:curved DNA-binding protein CbpA
MNPYEILGIPEDADKNTIKQAYRELAKKHHPDKGGDPEKFAPISEAYSVLSDPEKKRMYDENGIYVKESLESLQKATEDKFSQIVELWLKIKITERYVKPFFNFALGKISENIDQAEEMIEDIEEKQEGLDAFKGFAEVSEGENIFNKTIRKMENELNQLIDAANKQIYMSRLLEKELKRYKFQEMDEKEVFKSIPDFKIRVDPAEFRSFYSGSGA